MPESATLSNQLLIAMPTFAQARVRNAIPADSLQEAEQIVRKLQQSASEETATATPEPRPTGTGATAGPTEDPEADR